MGYFSFPDVKHPLPFPRVTLPISIHWFKAATDFREPPNKDLGARFNQATGRE